VGPNRSLNDANPRTLPTLVQRPQAHLPPAVRYVAVMEAALKECKRLAVRRFSRIMNAGENPMAWFYEIRDSNKAVAETRKGFDTQHAAMAAGRKKARELKASGLLPDGGVGTVSAGQDSEVLFPRK
jgi:hypothetical protein